jgi:hypothetical protein
MGTPHESRHQVDQVQNEALKPHLLNFPWLAVVSGWWKGELVMRHLAAVRKKSPKVSLQVSTSDSLHILPVSEESVCGDLVNK